MTPRRRPITPPTEHLCCHLCGGKLLPSRELPPRGTPYPSTPDYVCETCEHPFWWRGKPPRLVGLKGA